MITKRIAATRPMAVSTVPSLQLLQYATASLEPLTRYLQLAVTPTADRVVYRKGDAPQIRLTNPTSAPFRAMLLWGSNDQRRHLVSEPLPPGDAHVQMPPLGEECPRDACTVMVLLLATLLGTSRATTRTSSRS